MGDKYGSREVIRMSVSDTACVILAGGSGSRMRSTDRHKVCFPIAGVPAIVRTVGMLKSVGVRRFLIVVGQMAEQVIATVATEHPDVAFVFQAKPRGTGHAVACAVAVLRASGHGGSVLVTMGDKVIQPHVVAAILDRHAETGADVTLAALPKSDQSTAGRIVTDSGGKALGIVELPDIRRARESRKKIRVGGKAMTAAQVERASASVNPSLYIYKAPVLYDAIGALSDDNAQGELYLTDTVALIAAARGDVMLLDVPKAEDLMAYNTPEELLEIEEVFFRREAGRRRIAAATPRLSKTVFRTAREWLKLVQGNPPAMRRVMKRIYGDDADLLGDRRKALTAVLKGFAKTFGADRKVVISRAPGRINLMGRHVDHRGGYVNVMAISREVLIAASPREDDVMTLQNLQRSRFPTRKFSIGELLRAADWMDWMDYVNSSTVQQVLDAARGDWSNYAKAAVTRLQHACPDHRLHGMDCMVTGNIPMGAGLSSSSAIVVAVAEAAVTLNGLDVTPQQFVDLCGEGEWFVGSRGGSADHAAIRTGERGRVARVGFFPFRIEETLPFPSGLSLVIANSLVRASKSAGARDHFNQRVATYRLAEMLLRKRSAILANMEHLRDVEPEKLGVSPAEIYRAIRRLPRQITRRSAGRLLGGSEEVLEEIFASHANIGPYRLRDVAVYGIGECLRSDMFAGLMRGGKLDHVADLMKISHDGDRVVTRPEGWPTPFAPSYSDSVLDGLIRDAASEDPARRARSALWAQPGRYACSTEEIDLIVDLASAVPGVVGAQLAGAGLGGCAMILVADEALSPLMAALRKGYYRPRKLKFDVHVCSPVAGSGILKV